MPNNTTKLSDAELLRCLEEVVRCEGKVRVAARSLGIQRDTLRYRLEVAATRGLRPRMIRPETEAPASPRDKGDSEELGFMRVQMRRIENELREAQNAALSHAAVKRIITGTAAEVETLSPPAWIAEPRSGSGSFGVPTLFVSDLHWGEVVEPHQIGEVNAYNVSIAQMRLQKLHDSAIRLLTILSPERRYDGIVIPLGGDMVSGNIHDELMATNELNTMPTVVDLFSHLCSFIRSMADQFGRVFLPCVTGNHGRDTRKIWAKDRHHTSFDWLLYQFLAKHFSEDSRVSFLIPEGPDAPYRIYGHRYLLTHGDSFRGGDGVIGVLGPVIRGDYKKRARNTQVGQEYDTLLLGHFHQHLQLTKLIINGSLKGMDEYAWSGNFPYERAQQALWVTHPKHGITWRMPVYVDDNHSLTDEATKKTWVSI